MVTLWFPAGPRARHFASYRDRLGTRVSKASSPNPLRGDDRVCDRVFGGQDQFASEHSPTETEVWPVEETVAVALSVDTAAVQSHGLSPLRCMRPSRRAIPRHEPPQPLVPLLPLSFIRLSARCAAKLTSHECVSNQAEFGTALSAPFRDHVCAPLIAAAHGFPKLTQPKLK
jgi:hypothetical protein